ncbi:hypothetical protein DVA86_20325 [Streptomyces armeniacus]|uniref:Uncharacterized protein n=1 Tax=Streptomyces armeniacus TaxID=83291 RepID=A0A345XSM7_9ACTN|nr:hypothetical protein DVA86_20325 [Streptomyces armeniacus]
MAALPHVKRSARLGARPSAVAWWPYAAIARAAVYVAHVLLVAGSSARAGAATRLIRSHTWRVRASQAVSMAAGLDAL